MLVLRACGGRQCLVGTLSHHVRDALAVVAFLWLGGQATLLGMVVQTSTVITAAGDKGNMRRLQARNKSFNKTYVALWTFTSFLEQQKLIDNKRDMN